MQMKSWMRQRAAWMDVHVPQLQYPNGPTGMCKLQARSVVMLAAAHTVADAESSNHKLTRQTYWRSSQQPSSAARLAGSKVLLGRLPIVVAGFLLYGGPEFRMPRPYANRMVGTGVACFSND